ncbi:hypothetical protein E8E13_003570 [Curvularia kusanoi]|uniref:Heterokaryon incompatibility domain-containing protein n=1 Tax=Curvularia kusanoi TaxID=90978 RepID=A0A9P4T9Z2_CURKU|nr:hypothetical protein E8E13_003570 [Curvularia kusanoi]
MPSRVLDVAHVGSDIVRLTETAAGTGQYLALSHCWGGKVPIQTTSENYTAMMKGIDFTNLPRTFQDAVSVTRDLGQRYLWIDALCIIQDDTKDWEQESGNMAAIYQNAHMVIGADMSVSSHGGYLDSEGTYSENGKPIAIIDNDDASNVTTVYARKHGGHGSQCLMLPTWSYHDTPLWRRAWTLQEQFLATRMAHFDSKEIIWQCDTTVLCECMELDNSTRELSGRSRFIDSLASLSSDKYKAWYSIVDAIVRRDITKPGDILPALSGLARRIQDSGGGRYLAGLWLDDLPQGLLWFVQRNSYASRVDSFRAPSWSWASVQANQDVYEHGGELDSDTRLDPTWLTVKGAVSKPKGADPLGAVAGGYLKVYAPVLAAAIGPWCETLIPLGQSAKLRSSLAVYFDLAFDFSENDVLYCLFVGQLTHGGSGIPTQGLALKRLTGSSDGSYDGRFERVSMFGDVKGAFSNYKQLVRWSTVTII